MLQIWPAKQKFTADTPIIELFLNWKYINVITFVEYYQMLSSGSAESNSAESPNIVEPTTEESATEEPATEESATEEFDQFLCANGYDVKLKVGHFDIPVGATEEEMATILTKTN